MLRRDSLWMASWVALLVHCGGASQNDTPTSGGSGRDASVAPEGGASEGGAQDAPGRQAEAGSAGGDASVLDAVDADGATEAKAPNAEASTPDAPAEASDAPLTTDAPTACGVRTGMRGLTHRSMEVAGLMRTYLIYLPTTAVATTPMPFVFVFHGFTMSGQEMVDITDYTTLADSEGIGLAFPDGEYGPDSIGDPWNVKNAGQKVCGLGDSASASGNDFAFIDAMKADVAKDQCLDTAHIYSTGFSMGGYFSEHIGCYRSDMRAVAPHSGATLADLSVCTTGHVPIILFHGTSDSVIDDACDDPTVTADPGFPAAATLWAKKNGCMNTYTTTPTSGSGGGNGQCYLYDGCPADGQVELCTFTGMDHCWAGGDPSSNAVSEGSCPTYASATSMEWSFFKKYAW